MTHRHTDSQTTQIGNIAVPHFGGRAANNVDSQQTRELDGSNSHGLLGSFMAVNRITHVKNDAKFFNSRLFEFSLLFAHENATTSHLFSLTRRLRYFRVHSSQ